MTSAKTPEDIIEEIKTVENTGCEIIRISIPNEEAAKAIPQIKAATKMPIVADIHFNPNLAITALQNGADKIRINPGNFHDKSLLEKIIKLAKEKNAAIRIGINVGSLEKDLLEKHGHPTPEALVESALRWIKFVEDLGFQNFVVSIKSSDPQINTEANELLAAQTDVPLHIGVTEAGPLLPGVIKSAVSASALLQKGIGDTIRVSITAPIAKEVEAAKYILKSLGLYPHEPDIISCPTCARCEIDLPALVEQVQKATAHIKKPIRISVLGCAVNGPSEARESDFGIVGGKKFGAIYYKGEIYKAKVPEGKLLQEFLDLIEEKVNKKTFSLNSGRSTKKLAIFGSTGSIGKQTLEVVQKFPNDFRVVGLTAKSNATLLGNQTKKFGAKSYLGLENAEELIKEADYIINAVPGFEGLKISIATLQQGKTLLSANKESLAIAGKYLREIAEKHDAKIFPLDSEASALWQLMHEHGPENVSSVTITCSGGPFFGKTAEELKDVTVEQALAHPTWKMGPKISVDSATLINKVLEVFETHNLFNIPLSKIKIMIHPQSIVHGMIHTKTGATKMHITQNDMRLFISYALNYPNQPTPPWPIERTKKSELNFEQPDPQTFRSLHWLKLHSGNPNFPIVLNAMNDLATKLFLDGKIKFLQIYDLIEDGLKRFLLEVPPQTLEDVIKFHHRITDHYEHSNSTSSREITESRA